MVVLIPIADKGCFFALVLRPRPPRVLVVEVNNKHRMLQLDEKVPWILLCVIFCLGKVNSVVLAEMGLIDLVFEFLPGVLDRNVLHAKIRPQVFTPLHLLNVALVLNLASRLTERPRSATFVRFRGMSSSMLVQLEVMSLADWYLACRWEVRCQLGMAELVSNLTMRLR